MPSDASMQRSPIYLSKATFSVVLVMVLISIRYLGKHPLVNSSREECCLGCSIRYCSYVSCSKLDWNLATGLLFLSF